MNLKLILRLFLLVASGLQAQEFVERRVTVGDTSFDLPMPSKYMVIDKSADWAQAFFRSKEHALEDDSKNNTFILAMQNPDSFAASKKNGRVTGSFDCWAVYPNYTAKTRMSQKQFTALMNQVKTALSKMERDANMTEFVGLKSDKIRDADIRRQLASMTRPTVIAQTERSLTTVVKQEERYTLQAWLLVNGKLFFLYFNADADQIFPRIEEMNSWVKEIERKTQATTDSKPADANLGR